MALTRRSVLIIVVLAFMCACRDVDYLLSERAERNEIASSLEVFRSDMGRYPSAAEGLSVLLRNHEIRDWRGPYYPESKAAILAKYSYSLSDSGVPKLDRLKRTE